MKHAMWFVAVAALIVSGVLEKTRADAATLSYANDWFYNVPVGTALSGFDYFASTTDLANAGRATLAGTVWSGGTSGAFGSSPAQLNNGLYAPSALDGGVPNGYVDAQGTDTTLLATPNTTYTINFTSGMDISSINVYSAMAVNDRSKQNWSLEYRLAGQATYQTLISPFTTNVAQNSNGNRQGQWYNVVTLTPDVNELGNVDALRFTFLTPTYFAPTDGSNSTSLDTGYREIDVFGTAVGLIWDNAAGNAIWGNASANWTNGGANQAWTSGTAAVFGATGAGAVTVSGTIGIDSLTVSAAGYSFSGGQIDLAQASTTLEVNHAASISSVIGGANGLVKTGPATLTLGGANDYSGATTVNGGTLLVNGNQSAAAGAVTVASGATLGGSGQIGGAVTVDGILSPGNSPGVLSMPSLLLGGSSTTLMEITGLTRGGQYDGLDLTGSLTYGGTLSLNMSQVFGDATTFNLFSGFTSKTGDFSSIVSTGAAYNSLSFTRTGNLWTSGTSGTQWLEFDQTTGTLAVVPEPTGIAMAGVALAMCGWSMWKRRRG